jgi:KDO2-lipid IV(A) lauroyltransferase
VKIDYNAAGKMLSFDLLGAVRAGEIVSIQGDRMIPGIGEADGTICGQPVRLPGGPFTLALVSEAPIYPLFIARAGYRRYRVIVDPPINIQRTVGASRDAAIAAGVRAWCVVLERVVKEHWPQWFAFVSPFVRHAGH